MGLTVFCLQTFFLLHLSPPFLLFPLSHLVFSQFFKHLLCGNCPLTLLPFPTFVLFLVTPSFLCLSLRLHSKPLLLEMLNVYPLPHLFIISLFYFDMREPLLTKCDCLIWKTSATATWPSEPKSSLKSSATMPSLKPHTCINILLLLPTFWPPSCFIVWATHWSWSFILFCYFDLLWGIYHHFGD